MDDVEQLRARLAEVEAQLERYEKALLRYANRRNWRGSEDSPWPRTWKPTLRPWEIATRALGVYEPPEMTPAQRYFADAQRKRRKR